MAVEHTVRDVADFSYRPHLVTDATSSLNDEWHQASLSYALLNIAELTTTTIRPAVTRRRCAPIDRQAQPM